MKPVKTCAWIVMLFAVGLYSMAMAASVHLKGGKNAEPSFFDGGLTLSASGSISGLGEGDVVVDIEAEANVTATCTNPSGANEPPGQNPAPITVTGTTVLNPDERDKNGNTPFAVSTEAPDTPIEGAPDCPNPNWTEDITDLAFTSATITVYQNDVLVLTVTCSISPPSSNGAVPANTVSCTQS
jgi:hypothetical protein